MKKPNYVTNKDWMLLEEKYGDDMNYVLDMLKKDYPVQYLIGDVIFYGNSILVNENVLIPRFETEYLVEKTINYLTKYNFYNPYVLDIGTGSGCISIALKKQIPCRICAIDNSAEALLVADENAKRNQVSIDFKRVDIISDKLSGKFDVIISNPPYIAKGDVVDKSTKYEPQSALYADNDGLIFYETILKKSKSILNKQSLIAFEIGMNQGEQVVLLAKSYYPNSQVFLEKDLNLRNRYVFILNLNE